MKTIKKSTAGAVTRSNTALAILAATILVGGTATEASARSRHHHYRHYHHHAQASEGTSGSSWRDANASIGATGGHSFTGVASMYALAVSTRYRPGTQDMILMA